MSEYSLINCNPDVEKDRINRCIYHLIRKAQKTDTVVLVLAGSIAVNEHLESRFDLNCCRSDTDERL